VLQSFTREGLRVIAAATKPLNANLRWTEVDSMSRPDLEEKAKFLGLIIMKNSVTEPTVRLKYFNQAKFCMINILNRSRKKLIQPSEVYMMQISLQLWSLVITSSLPSVLEENAN